MTLSIPDPPGPVTLGALSCPHCLLAEAAQECWRPFFSRSLRDCAAPGKLFAKHLPPGTSQALSANQRPTEPSAGAGV